MAIHFSTAENYKMLARAVKAERMRKLANQVFSDDLKSAPEEVIVRHRLEIVAWFYPGAVISHRSAIESALSPAGVLHVTIPRTSRPLRSLPGMDIRVWEGPPARPDDIKTGFDPDRTIFTSSQARAVLENLQIARARTGEEPKILSPEELERWIDRQIRVFGPDWLVQLQAKAQEVAAAFNWKREGEQFVQLVAAWNGRKSSYRLRSDIARARATGKPFDPERLTLFGNLHARLAREQFPDLPRPPAAEFDNRAFWEAYFSNFIEGTRFTVEEARAIVYETDSARSLLERRPEDAHDVRETFRLIVDPNVSAEVPVKTESLFEVLKRRHARMMASRPAVEPGVFKRRSNEFGSRVFVKPELVQETLARAWQGARSLASASARALYVLFVLAEVHPFNDGNGRISRLGMNAELEAARQARWILPTSFRGDYLSVLEALTTRWNPDPFVAFAHKLIEVNRNIPFHSFDATHEYFRSTGALDERVAPLDLRPWLSQT